MSRKKEGFGFIPDPTFIEIGNGRLKCVETGHELPAPELESYARSKRCRSGLIDAALLQNKPPLNAFKLDPLSRSKLICKLTGDTINKTEQHVLKHINGKRFLGKLEQTESGLGDESHSYKPRKNVELRSKNKMDDKEKEIAVLMSEIREAPKDDSDTEEDDGFWMPPGGFGSGSGSEEEEETVQDSVSKECAIASKELSKRTKRMTIEIGPSSFATRKKKNKLDPIS